MQLSERLQLLEAPWPDKQICLDNLRCGDCKQLGLDGDIKEEITHRKHNQMIDQTATEWSFIMEDIS